MQIAVKNLYEKNGLTPEEIAEDLKMSLEAVKLILLSCSGKYRKQVAKDQEEDINLEMKDLLVNIARTQAIENPSVAVKAASFILDYTQGKKRAASNLSHLEVNFNVINERLQRAKEIASRVLEIEQQTEAN